MANNELLKLTAHQVKEGKYDKAILAIGSCEAHGQHIAEGCDTIVSGDGFDTPLVAEVAGAQAYDVFISTHCSFTNEAENVQNFVKAYTDAYGTAPENAFAALGYDAMDLIGKALESVEDPTDTAAIKDAIEATSGFQGITGTISYTAESHKPDKTASILELVDGEFQFITEE